MFRNVIGGLFFVFLMFLSTFLGAIFMLGPILPLLFFRPNWFRYISDKLMATWLPLPVVSINIGSAFHWHVCAAVLICFIFVLIMWWFLYNSKAVLEILFGMSVHVTSEDFPSNLRNDRAVIIMNHRTRLDWLYYWSVILRQGKLENEKIILKNELKHIPGAGWAMQIAMFIFLKRNWEKDEKYLHKILHYFTDTKYPLQLLIFPEGTDYDTHSAKKSTSYALKNNLPIYKHVLHPRLRGFTYCVEQLRSRDGIDAIYDVTVGYHGNICQSESELARGKFPQHVHFHTKRYPIHTVPESTEGLEKWCKEKWTEKEASLDRFYKEGRFVPEQEEKATIVDDSSSIRYQMIFWIVYWLAFICVAFTLLYYFSWIRWYAVIVGAMFFLQSTYGGGFEMLQVKRHALTTANHQRQNSQSEQNVQNCNGTNTLHEAMDRKRS